MSIFIYITGIGILIFCLFLGLLIWSIRSGQMDDLELPPDKILWPDHTEDK